MMTNKLEQETFKPLFISRSDICVVLGMKPTTLDAFIYRTVVVTLMFLYLVLQVTPEALHYHQFQ